MDDLDDAWVISVPRRWWQKRRWLVRCPRCGWESEPQIRDASGLGDFKLTFALIDHRVTTDYSCGRV